MWDQVDALFAKYENLPIGEKKRLVGAGRAAMAAWACRRTSPVRPCFWRRADADYIVAQTLNVDGGNWMS